MTFCGGTFCTPGYLLPRLHGGITGWEKGKLTFSVCLHHKIGSECILFPFYVMSGVLPLGQDSKNYSGQLGYFIHGELFTQSCSARVHPENTDKQALDLWKIFDKSRIF